MNRPVGITVLAILQIIGGALSIIVGGLAVLGGAMVATTGNDAAAMGGIAAIVGIVSLLLGVAGVVLGIGMLQLKEWAWMGTLVVQGIGILFNIITIVAGGGFPFLSLAISIGIIVYLMQPQVKTVFGK